jgi:hypothetical protein
MRVIQSYLTWKRFEHPPQLFLGGIGIEEDGSRHMLHAWTIIDTEFKKYQDEESDPRAKSKTPPASGSAPGGMDTGDEEDDWDEGPGTDSAGFPKLKGDYTPIT